MFQKVYQNNIFSSLEEIIQENKYKQILLISTQGLLDKLNILDQLKNILQDKKIYIYDQASENPQVEIVEKGLEFAKKNKIDLIIALGGGSAIDTAKAIAVFLNNSGRIIDYLLVKKQIKNQPVSLIAVPTTAGTGSEATKYAALYYKKGAKIFKKSLEHPFLIPQFVILDPVLLLTLDRFRTAVTGLDALSQAIESYWSIYSTEQSRKYASRAIRLIISYLLKGSDNLENILYRKKMLLASHFSGQAINLTKTTICHSVSYPLTNYFKIPHGLGCALTLPSFLQFNFEINEGDCNDSRGIKFVKERIQEICNLIIGSDNIQQACQTLNNLMLGLGLKINLRESGVDNIDLIIQEGFTPERAKNNPRLVKAEDLKNILNNIF